MKTKSFFGKKYLNLDIRGVLVQDDFDAEAGGRSSEGILGVTVGVSYKFNAIRKQ